MWSPPEDDNIDSGEWAPPEDDSVDDVNGNPVIETFKELSGRGYETSPTVLMGDVLPGLARKGAEFVGGKYQEDLIKHGANPTAAKAIGTVMKYGPDIAMMAVPGGSTSKLNALQKTGGQMMNKALGIKPKTVEMMAKGANPSEFGAELGIKLNKQGLSPFSASKAFDVATHLQNKYGKSVESAMDAIRQSGKDVSVLADDALKPVVDDWASRADAALSVNRQTAKPFEEIYTNLSKKAQSMGGKLSVDDVRDALQEVGRGIENASVGSTKESAYSDLYGKLANVREDIVSKVAEQAGDPSLASNLKSANKGYSDVLGVLPDIRKAATQEGAGGTADLSGHWWNLYGRSRPLVAKGLIGAGELVQGMETGLKNLSTPLSNLAKRPIDIHGSNTQISIPQEIDKFLESRYGKRHQD